MSKVDLKNISGGVLKFFVLKGGQEGEGMANNEVLLVANDAQLGPEIEDIRSEASLNTIQSFIYEGKIQILENDVPLPIGDEIEKNAAIKLFNDEIEIVDTFIDVPILRANSLVTQDISNSDVGTIVKWENIRETRKITVDPSTGNITSEVNASFSYNISLNLDVTSGWSGSIQAWFEVKVGGNWVLYPNSGWNRDFGRMNEGHVIYSGVLNLISGVKFRMKIRSSQIGARLLKESFDSQSQTVDVPSALITVHG